MSPVEVKCLTLVLLVGIVVVIFAALAQAFRVLAGESSYDPVARREAVASAVFALILAALLVLVVGLLAWCVWHFRAFFLE